MLDVGEAEMRAAEVNKRNKSPHVQVSWRLMEKLGRNFTPVHFELQTHEPQLVQFIFTSSQSIQPSKTSQNKPIRTRHTAKKSFI
jgi:hypothetical protein